MLGYKGTDHLIILQRINAAGRIDEHAPFFDKVCRGCQQLPLPGLIALQSRKRPLPADIRLPPDNAQAGTGRINENARKSPLALSGKLLERSPPGFPPPARQGAANCP